MEKKKKGKSGGNTGGSAIILESIKKNRGITNLVHRQHNGIINRDMNCIITKGTNDARERDWRGKAIKYCNRNQIKIHAQQ